MVDFEGTMKIPYNNLPCITTYGSDVFFFSALLSLASNSFPSKT